MDILQRIAGDDRFNAATLTKLLQDEDYAPGQIMSLGIFEPQPVTTTQVVIDELGGKFSIVPTSIRGEAPPSYTPDKRKSRTLNVPHIPYETVIAAEYLQNMRAADSGDALETVQGELVRRLGMMARDLDGTIEHKLAGALRGILVDADDTTVIVNLFTEFGVAQPSTIPMDLTAASPASGAVKKKCNGVVRAIGDELKAKTPRGYYALCGPAYYDDFTCNAEVAKAFERYTDNQTNGQVGAFNRDSQVRQAPFKFGGIAWEEYRGGSSFISDDEAIVFPIGVPDLYVIHYAPANMIEFLNTLGVPRYGKVWPTDNSGRSLTAHTQTNPLPVMTKPRAARRLTRGAS